MTDEQAVVGMDYLVLVERPYTETKAPHKNGYPQSSPPPTLTPRYEQSWTPTARYN